MTSYLFVETRAAAESPDVDANLAVASGLRAAQHDVTLFLVQNAVLMAGKDAATDAGERPTSAGLSVWVDDHSLASRGLPPEWVSPDVHLGSMADLVRMLATPGVVAVWH